MAQPVDRSFDVNGVSGIGRKARRGKRMTGHWDEAERFGRLGSSK